MTYGGYGDSAGDPFAGDPFDSSAPGYGPPVSFGPSGQPSPPKPEVNKLATLSVVFAFVFAPVGAVLGHLALSEIKLRREPGRSRAVLGLTLSYAIIVLALIATAVWLIVGAGRTGSGATTAATTATPSPSVGFTVVTPPPRSRPTINVENLHLGDCVEIQDNEPAAGQPNTDYIFIYRVPCQVREGVFQVRQLVPTEDKCTTTNVIYNQARTVFACISDFTR